MPRAYPTTTPDWRRASRRRSLAFLLAAITLAVLFGLLSAEIYRRQQPYRDLNLVPAVYSVTEQQPGRKIGSNDLELKSVPSFSLPERFYSRVDQVQGQTVRYPLSRGQVITPGHLAGTSSGIYSGLCPRGRWCLSLPRGWLAAPPPELAPGDMLEIAAALPGEGRDGAGFIATEVEVIAVDHKTNPGALILALEGQEAVSLLYARANGYQLLVLVRPED